VADNYLLTFGGFLLLAGRMGDLFGHRRVFLTGLTVFTSASLACGLVNSPTEAQAAVARLTEVISEPIAAHASGGH
jgi:MFS family permease